MKHIKQTIIASVLVFTCMIGTGILVAQPASAMYTAPGGGGGSRGGTSKPDKKPEKEGVKCAVLPQGLCDNAGKNDKNGHSAIWNLLLLILNILTAGVGVAAVIGIVIASIMYASAEDKSDQVSKAKMMIWNTALGLIAYLLMFAFLQFIIPGGVFS